MGPYSSDDQAHGGRVLYRCCCLEPTLSCTASFVAIVNLQHYCLTASGFPVGEAQDGVGEAARILQRREVVDARHHHEARAVYRSARCL